MKSKKLTLICSIGLILVLLASLVLVACAKEEAPAAPAATETMKPVIWQVQTNQPYGSPGATTYLEFSKTLFDYTGGLLKVEVFPSSGLGFATMDTFKAVSTGQLLLAEASSADVAGFIPGIGAMDLPMLTQDKDPEAMIAMGEATFDMVSEEFLKHGVVLLLWVPLGIGRGFDTTKMPTSQDPKTPLKGFKLRTCMPVSDWGAEVLGGIPMRIEFAEVYIGMEQGILDGHDLGPYVDTTINTKICELAPYKYNLQFGDTTWAWHCNKDAFDALPLDWQQKVLEAGRTAMRTISARWQEKDRLAWPRVRDEFGGEYIEPSEETLAWVNSQAEIYRQEWIEENGEFGKKLVDTALAAAKKYYQK